MPMPMGVAGVLRLLLLAVRDERVVGMLLFMAAATTEGDERPRVLLLPP
jgi:hypothetical protein